MYIYSEVKSAKVSAISPRPAYFCGLKIVSLEHRFSGCCLLAFGDPKATLHDLRNKKGRLFLKRHVLKKHKKGFQKNLPHKIFQYFLQKSHSAGPLQRHLSFFLWDFMRSPFGVSLFVLGMLSSVRQPFQMWAGNIQPTTSNKIMETSNE